MLRESYDKADSIRYPVCIALFDSLATMNHVRELSLSKPLRTQRADIKLVVEQFGSDGDDRAATGSSYVYLDRLLLASNANEREMHLRTLSAILAEWLAETSFHELALAFAALTAVQQTDLQAAVAIYSYDGMESRIQDAGELIAMPQKLVEESEYTRAKTHFALFVAQAAGYSKTAKLAERLASLSDGWLKHSVGRKDEDKLVRAAAMLVSVKLGAIRSPNPTTARDESSGTDYSLLEQLVVDASSDQDIDLMAVLMEVTSIGTLKPEGRREIAKRPALIRAVMAQSQYSQLQFGAASTLRNLTSYRTAASADEKTTAQLRQYANSGGKASESEEEADIVVDKRNQGLIGAGIVASVLPLCKSASPVIRDLAGCTLHNLVRPREHRASIIQQGGARLLLALALQIQSKPDLPASADSAETVQALAKLLITANPVTVFRSGASGLENSVSVLATLFVSGGSTRLQRFEALMALTNIASVSEDLADRIANASRLLDAVDETLLDSSADVGDEGVMLCRRAAMQLICNIAVSEIVFLRYTAADQADDLECGRLPAAVAARLRIILALADVDDLQTRQAALAAISQFTYAQTACAFLAAEEKRFNVIFSALEDDDAGMQLRAIACMSNIVKEVPEKISEIRRHLQQSLQVNADAGVQAATKEILASI